MLRLSLLILTCLYTALNAGEKVLLSFESPAELKGWEFKKGKPALVSEHATDGKQALKVAAHEYLVSFRFPKDWSGYDALDVDIFVEGNESIGMSLLVADEDHDAKRGYWNRHNSSHMLTPGANTLSIPCNGLFRGEAGSRGNDLKTNINPAKITRIDLGFQGKETLNVFIDNFRLVKESRPEGILAFDFGPPAQSVFPGFTPITYNTVYAKGQRAGLKNAHWGSATARDDTFPSRLYQDYVRMDGAEFITDLPNGAYGVWVMFDDLGYWGGEQAHYRKRWIQAEGQEAWKEEPGESGLTDFLYRFEKVEPRIGLDVWSTYMQPLFTAKRLNATVADGTLNLRFHADGANACKVAGLIIYPEAKKAEADRWIAEVEKRNRLEFEKQAQYLGKANQPSGVLGFPSIADVVLQNGEPGDPNGKMQRIAAKGQRVSFTFAARPQKDHPDEIKLTVSDLKGPAGTIPAAQVEVRYVHHALQRSYNRVAYTIEPESLRKLEGSGLKFEANLTRQFWLTLAVPPDAKPGVYTGEVSVTPWLERKLPLTVEVLDLALDEPEFKMGFYGTHVPAPFSKEQRAEAWRKLFLIQREYGMNIISGGPSIQFAGLDAAGKPKLDFSACDEYFRIAKECGLTGPFMSYGGPAMVENLHGGYVIGERGREWEKQTGKPMSELLKIVWGAVKEHAQQQQWPHVMLGMIDEPRVIERINEHLELLRLYREHVPFVDVGGSYSVHWNDKPFEKGMQELFKTVNWSALNLHEQTDLDKGKEFNKQVWIYNQGTSRYSFGAYQWAEFRKGVRGRMQWHLLCLHGWQFFDLDGREPDSAMINWGRDEIIPTIHFARAREGADDFRFAVTLYNLAQKKKDTPAAQAALAWLDEVSAKIKVNQNQRPDGFMDDETFRNTCIEHIRKLK